jgi:tetratricopeptide (TPR) repeat protein
MSASCCVFRAGGYAALAGAYSWSGKWAKAIELAKQGLALDLEEPELLNNYSQNLRALGFLKESLRVRQQLALVEPFNALYNRQTAELMLANRKIDAGLKALEALHGAAIATATLSRAYAWQDRFTEAADALLQTPVYPNAQPMFEAAARLLRSAADKTKPLAELPVFDSELNFVYAYVGAPERMLDWPDQARRSGDYRPILSLWWPMPSSVRKTERFKTLVRDAGMADYCHAHGWPDLCHPVERDDFVATAT